MITLKKSFELQNYMKGLLNSALLALAFADNITITKQEHMRKKSYENGEDEIIIKPKRPDFSYEVMELVDFTCHIQNTMDELTAAINDAKHSGLKDYDGMISINNRKHTLLNRLNTMAAIKPSEVIKSGQGWKFNGEGNQVSYSYDIKETTTIDFDRNVVKAIISRLRKEVDKTSAEIDLMQLETMVDFNTIYEIGDSLEDAVEKYKERNKQ